MAGTPPPGYADTEHLCLTRDGTWLSNGSPVTHQAQVDAFFRGIERHPGGWRIRVGQDTKEVQVEDTGFFVRSMEGTPGGGFTLILSDGTMEPLDEASLRYLPGRLTCRIRGGAEEARFLSAPYHDLLSGLVQDENGYWITIREKRYLLAPGDEP
jgi:hypothetical protein